ncbi:MAG: 23S rRNA (guanosine(2251)-2'-O)-methyltransferase RlmB, partial [Acidobacteria bacterium]|nr:23S rRNA (guanosine(2251)-2'-O)-methyltransferase RlmB [Acidobacteriota bacterium]NIQ29263.1 23S rRNA (guanosine(2251)-2'-O)-methyltransferase RlmB [Acidobacteriota bacterium]
MKRKPAAEGGEQMVYGVHPVMELLERSPREIARIWVAREDDRKLGRLLKAARR